MRFAHRVMRVRVMHSARTYALMHNTSVEHISEKLREKNIQLDTIDPVVQGGFTQVPNFILENPELSVGAKVIYAMFLRYAWHNDKCFPGQARLAEDIGMSIGRVNQFIKELEAAQLIEIIKRGQGKTNLYTIKFRVKPKQKG
jgi:Helix-turn-helix domain